MNERVESDSLIEVSNTKHTRRKNANGEEIDDSDEESTIVPKKDEAELQYHESVINDIYGSMSSEEDDEDNENNDESEEQKLER